MARRFSHSGETNVTSSTSLRRRSPGSIARSCMTHRNDGKSVRGTSPIKRIFHQEVRTFNCSPSNKARMNNTPTHVRCRKECSYTQKEQRSKCCEKTKRRENKADKKKCSDKGFRFQKMCFMRYFSMTLFCMCYFWDYFNRKK